MVGQAGEEWVGGSPPAEGPSGWGNGWQEKLPGIQRRLHHRGLVESDRGTEPGSASPQLQVGLI